VADILPFKRKPAPKRSVLCENGHHHWAIWQKKPFDSKQGKLVTVYRCERCGAKRSEAR
jgi:DNA-directed RNA polymerase subunit M/transcription elongation factor TFIIS